jgi:hypothetical protein
MTGGVRLMYVIDHAAVLPCSLRSPLGMRRRRGLARLVLASGILTSSGTGSGSINALAGQTGGWLCASVGSRQRALPLEAVLGGSQIAEAFRVAVPASLWRRVSAHRSAFLAAHQRPGLVGRLGGEGR